MGRRGSQFKRAKAIIFHVNGHNDEHYPLTSDGKHVTDMKRAQRILYKKKEEINQSFIEPFSRDSSNFSYMKDLCTINSDEERTEIVQQDSVQQEDSNQQVEVVESVREVNSNLEFPDEFQNLFEPNFDENSFDDDNDDSFIDF